MKDAGNLMHGPCADRREGLACGVGCNLSTRVLQSAGAPLREIPADSNGAVTWHPGEPWSSWDLMKRFFVGNTGKAFAQLIQLAERASNEPSDEVISDALKEFALEALVTTRSTIHFLGLTETKSCVERVEWRLNNEKIPNKEIHYSFHHLTRLMQSELEKQYTFALDQEKEKYFRDTALGIELYPLVAGLGFPQPIPPLFSDQAQRAFPSMAMDLIEAGRCLALERNNAAIYHLMQVAEIGLRALAWDRRVQVERGKNKVIIPLNYAQWGEIIGKLIETIKEIDHWQRSKAIKEEAKRFYTVALFEVESFNEIYRKHISHARGELYPPETAISCWGHVSRFMDRLSERITETTRTRTVWKVNP
jgi:hypothetical protein